MLVCSEVLGHDPAHDWEKVANATPDHMGNKSPIRFYMFSG
uniref:Uncharacterized protein n=1 Tax=Arundo donax TaxID=35708 RepID=A0A0A9C9V5_ARUDO